MIKFSTCRAWLTALWVFGALGLGLLLIFAARDLSGDAMQKIWAWFLPTVMPTVTLIISVITADAVSGSKRTQTTSSFFFGLTCVVSLVYLIAVAAPILAPAAGGRVSLEEQISRTGLFLGPFQSVVAALIGVFFTQPSREPSSPPPPPPIP